jgi:SAM-dependent methyltransferase
VAARLAYLGPLGYELVMLALYGTHYWGRYRAVADLVPHGAEVLDLCCGPGVLYRRYLRRREVRYIGWDLNRRFVTRLTSCGGHGRVCDVLGVPALPQADVVVMQGSLYHFLPDARPVLVKMLRAARLRVIVAEPVRNWATSRIPLAGRIARAATRVGDRGLRFTEQSLDDLFATYRDRVEQAFLIPGGRDKVYVLEGSGVRSRGA